MDNSTEELTPILVPFEKNIRSNSGGKYDYNPLRSEAAYELNTEKAMANLHSEEGRRADSMLGPGSEYGRKMHGDHPEGYMQTQPSGDPVTSTKKQKKDAENYGPDVLTGPGSEYYSKMHGTNAQTASSGARSSSTTPKGGNWTGGRGLDHVPGVMNGLAMASNLGASFVGGLDKAGQASRKLVQGILNPGLMGQGAAMAATEAASTMMTPTKQDQIQHANTIDSINLYGAGREAKAAQKQSEARDAMRNAMIAQARSIFQQAQANAGITDIYNQGNTEAQNKQFTQEYGPKMEALIQSWWDNGMDPEMIKELGNAYLDPLNHSGGRYKFQSEDLPSAAKNVAQENHDLMRQNEKVSTEQRTAQNLHTQLTAISANSNIPGAAGYLDWARKNTPTVNYNGQLVPSGNTMFVDASGNALGADNFDASTARINYRPENRENLGNYLNHLDNASATPAERRKNRKAAAQIRAGMKDYDHEEMIKQNTSDAQYFANHLSKNARKSGLLANGLKMKGVRSSQAAMSANLFQRYGAQLGLDAETIRTFAEHGGFSSTDATDLSTLEKFHGAMTTDRLKNGHFDKLRQITDDIRKGKIQGPLTPEQLQIYRDELMYENLTYRIQAMKKMQALNENTESFRKKVDLMGSRFRDSEGYPIYMSMLDNLRRYRDVAYSRYMAGLNALNDDLDEVTLATGTGATSGMIAADGNFYNFNGVSPSRSQAMHLAKMVVSDHDPADPNDPGRNMLGFLADDGVAKFGSQINLYPLYGKGAIDTGDRRIRTRLGPIFKQLDDANNLIGERREMADSGLDTPSESDDVMSLKAQAESINRQIRTANGEGDDSVYTQLLNMRPPQGATTFLNPALMRQYKYGEFPNGAPTANDIANINSMVTSLDDIINAPSGTYNADDIAAATQYRAALITNLTASHMKSFFDATKGMTQAQKMQALTHDPIGRALLSSYQNFSRSNLTSGGAYNILQSITNSLELNNLSSMLRLSTVANGGARSALGPTGIGNRPTRRTSQANIMSDPSMVLGLMNEVYATMYP